MKTTLMAVLAASTALIGLAGQASAQGRPPAPPMAAQKIKPDLYFITGGGGNSELLVTKSGALLVDDKYFAQPNYDDLLKVIAGATDQKVKVVVVTHHHADHTGNNERFLASGATVIGNKNMPDILKKYTTKLMDHNPAAPNVTYDANYDVKLGGKVVAKLYHFGPGHTGADTIVLFPADKAISFGDLIVEAPTYPNYDAGVGGGSLLGLEHSLGEALKLKWDIAFPGHGEKPLTRDEVVDYKKKIDVLISRIRSAIDAGTPKSQLIQSLYTEDLGWKIGGTFWAPPERVDALVDELSKH